MSSYERLRSRSRSPLSRPRRQHSVPDHHQQQYDGSDHSSYHWSGKWKQDQWTNNNWSESWSTDSWSNTFKDGSPFPASWKPDADHLDTNEVHGLAMGRRVAKTAWSSDKGLSGKLLEDISLADLAFAGHNNWYFRHLSAGRFTSIEFTRSVKESLLVQSILKACRMKDSQGQSLDLDKLIHSYAQSTSSKQAEVYQAAAVKLFEHMKEAMPVQQATDQLDKVRALEAELQKYKAAVNQPQEFSTPTKVKTPSSNTAKKNGIKAFMSPKAGDDLPIEGEKDQEVEDEPENDPQHGIYARGKRQKVLKQKHPTVTTTPAFNKWLKETLSSKQQTAFKDAHKSIQEHYNSKEKELKAELPDLASDWGLPVKLSATADTQWLLKILTVAVILSQ